MSAHACENVLPKTMVFRPMAEMIPECLEAQVQIEIQETEDDMTEGSFTSRLIQRLARDKETAEPVVVDPLSLSSLLSQGFDEGPARRALRLHNNDTQQALDWLIRGGGDEPDTSGTRASTTMDQLLNWDEVRSQMRERFRRREEQARDESAGVARPPPVGLGVSVVS